MDRKNLALMAILILVPLGLFLVSEYVLDSGLDMPAPSGFITFENIAADWDSYDYGFFESEIVGCDPEKYGYSPRMDSFEKTEEVAQLSYSLTAGAVTGLEKAYNLFEYVSNDIEYVTYTDTWRTTTEVLDSLEGDCTDKAIVLVSLLLEAGIESYVVYGGESENGDQHAWVVANIGEDWFQMDATSTDFYYVYKCKVDPNCVHEKYYNHIIGVFGPEIALKCTVK